jgi:hypothetical protein
VLLTDLRDRHVLEKVLPYDCHLLRSREVRPTFDLDLAMSPPLR